MISLKKKSNWSIGWNLRLDVELVFVKVVCYWEAFELAAWDFIKSSRVTKLELFWEPNKDRSEEEEFWFKPEFEFNEKSVKLLAPELEAVSVVVTLVVVVDKFEEPWVGEGTEFWKVRKSELFNKRFWFP